MDKATEFIDKYIELCREYGLCIQVNETFDRFRIGGVASIDLIEQELRDSLTEAE